jgi:hypothetical protein
MMDRDFNTIFTFGVANTNTYSYPTEYSEGAVVTYGRAELGDAYPFQLYNGSFLNITNAIGQSTPFPSQDNTITVTLATTVPLKGGSKVTLSGFRYCTSPAAVDSCYMATPTSTLAIEFASTGTTADYFDTTVQWNRQEGTIVATLSRDSVAGMQYVFSFTLRNPSTCSKNPVSIRVTAGCCIECSMTYILQPDRAGLTTMCGQQKTGWAEVLRIISPSFASKSLVQSTALPCHRNTITVSISVNVDMPASTNITLSGLEGTATPDSALVITITGHPLMQNLNGRWAKGPGTLVFQLTNKLDACTLYAFSFEVTKKLCRMVL